MRERRGERERGVERGDRQTDRQAELFCFKIENKINDGAISAYLI